MSLACNKLHSFLLLLFGDIAWKNYCLQDQWISRCSVSPYTRCALSTARKTSLSEHGCSWLLTHKAYTKAICSSTLCSTSPFLYLSLYLVNSWVFRFLIKRRDDIQNYRIICHWKSYRLTKLHLVACLGLYQKHFSGTQQAFLRAAPAALWAAADDNPTTPARLLLCRPVSNSAPWQRIRPAQGTLLLGKHCSTHIK